MGGLYDNFSSLNISNASRDLLDSSDCLNFSSDCKSLDEINNDIYILKVVINFVIFPILTIIGLFGNLSTVIAFSQKKTKTSTSYLITGLAVSDLLFISVRLIANIYSIGHVFFTEAVRFARPNTFFWMYSSLIPQRIGNHIVCAVVIERFMAVWFPIKFKEFFTTKKSKTILTAIILFNLVDLISGINIFIFCLNEEIPERGEISSVNEMERYLKSSGKFFQLCSLAFRIIGDAVPLLLVFVFNSLIIVGIRRDTFKKTQRRKDKEAKMTRMLLGVSVLFVLLGSPLTITMTCIIIGVMELSRIPIYLYETFSIFIVINSVINFIVYGLCNKSIRNDYLELWRIKKETSDSSATMET